MRLSIFEQSTIVDCVKKFDPLAEVWLYGSRTDDLAHGGDIDLVVFGQNVSLSQKLDLLIALKQRLGDRKIDLKLLLSQQRDADPIAQLALSRGVRLT